MARLKSRDETGMTEGRLSSPFQDAALTALQRAFLATPGAPEAAETLEKFREAADTLLVSEGAFTARPRDADGPPDLIHHLRTPEQFAALRGFAAAKEALLEANPEVGGRIVRLVTAPRI